MATVFHEGQQIHIDLRNNGDVLRYLQDLPVPQALALFLSQSDPEKGRKRFEVATQLFDRQREELLEIVSKQRKYGKRISEEEAAHRVYRIMSGWVLTTVDSSVGVIHPGETLGHYNCPNPDCGSKATVMWILPDEPCSVVACVDCGMTRREVGHMLESKRS